MSDSNMVDERPSLSGEIVARLDQVISSFGGQFTIKQRLVLTAWYAALTAGEKPGVLYLADMCDLSAEDVTAILNDTQVMAMMTKIGNGFVDTTCTFVALRMADQLVNYANDLATGKVKWEDIPKEFRDEMVRSFRERNPMARADSEKIAAKGGDNERNKFRDDDVDGEAAALLSFPKPARQGQVKRRGGEGALQEAGVQH